MAVELDAEEGTVSTLISEAGVKAKALEEFINIAVRDCRFDELLTEILVVMAEAIPCEAGSIFELNSEQKSLSIRIASGQSVDQLASITIPVGQGVVGHVAESMMPVLVANADENKMHMKTVARLTGLEVKNLMAAPFVIRGGVYGVVELINKVGGPTFNEGDLNLLHYLAQMASRVIEIRMMLNWVKQAKQAA